MNDYVYVDNRDMTLVDKEKFLSLLERLGYEYGDIFSREKYLMGICLSKQILGIKQLVWLGM